MAKVKVHSQVRQVNALKESISDRLMYMLTLLLVTATLTEQQEVNNFNVGELSILHSPQMLSGGMQRPRSRQLRHHSHRNAGEDNVDDTGGGDHSQKLENFVLTDTLNDGECERRISWNGIIGKETSLADTSSNKTLSLWQMAGKQFLIQIIYNSDREMMDCEYVRMRPLVHQFRERFSFEYRQARARNFTSPYNMAGKAGSHSLVSDHDFREYIEHDIVTPEMKELQYNVYDFPAEVPASHRSIDAFGMRNLSYTVLHNRADIPADLLDQMNFHELKQKCNVRQKQLKEIATGLRSSDPEHKRIANEKLQRHKRAIADWFLSPNTKWCGKGHSASQYYQLGGASRADMCCRKHDHCNILIPAMATHWDLFNIRPFTISHCSCDTRQRRDLSDMLRVPGTKWCGKGWSARNYVEMGGFSKADRCCRQHDLSCPFWILGFETKYSLFNWRVNTLMHCGCDERFRTCLKMADSSDANLVGKLFFNIVQMKCFVLKPVTVCEKRSFWGKCEKKSRRKRAFLRDNRKF
ncbi:uncharacterized protein LOC128730151 [Anopheles nili]|uniref:uncharacterized protein LOC128730151 n=1 Tax=Anopheles nili TaxID=185578 RepID=UPI00237C27B6|nr:uncharacterized protein LOC128730151 [Anopheles nili]